MRNFYEKLLDILYDYSDWLIMALVIVVIVATIGWRLDILFEKHTADLPAGDTIVGDKDEKDKDKDQELGDKDKDQEENLEDPDGELDKEGGEDSPEDPDKDKTKDSNDNERTDKEPEGDKSNSRPISPSGETVRVVIPDGSPSTSIGDILTNNGLISSSSDFVKRAEELGLDRRLQSGSFDIPKNASLDDIIKIVAKRM